MSTRVLLGMPGAAGLGGEGPGMGAMGECVVCASDKDHDGWREVGTGMFERCKMRFSRLLL